MRAPAAKADAKPTAAPAPTAVPATTRTAPTPLPPDQLARVQSLAAQFRRACATEAFTELRTIRDQHGSVPTELRDALLVAYKACDEPVAAAKLIADTLPAQPSTTERLQLGAAWLRATEYETAAEVLVPLATEQGPSTQAAWLAGFALFHSGNSAAALPWLEGARDANGGKKSNHPDRPLLIGLARLHTDDLPGAITELEAGVAKHPDHTGLNAALTRAYTKAGRSEDAAQSRKKTEQAYAKSQAKETSQLRLSALGNQLNKARAAGQNDEVLRLISEMLPHAPPKLLAQLLTLRIGIYEQTGRTAEAEADREQLATLPPVPTPGGQP